MGGGLLEPDLRGSADGRERVDVRGVWLEGIARWFLVSPSGESPLRLPLGVPPYVQVNHLGFRIARTLTP